MRRTESLKRQVQDLLLPCREPHTAKEPLSVGRVIQVLQGHLVGTLGEDFGAFVSGGPWREVNIRL